MRAFIYALIDPSTGLTRYVGKSTAPQRRLRRHLSDARRSSERRYLWDWLRKLDREGLAPLLQVLEQPSDWASAERRWIALGRAQGLQLTNLRDGGEGGVFPLEVRQKISAAKKGRKQSPEHIAKLAAVRRGRRVAFSDDHRANLSVALSKPRPWAQGVPHSDSHRAAISEAIKEHWKTRRAS